MYDLLKFIDSQDVREYNQQTYFTPAEWAVIVGLSITRTVEEKIDALQYLVDQYGEAGFEEESANMEPRTYGYKNTMPSREVVIETIKAWENVLQNRYRNDGIYAAKLVEKGVGDALCDYSFFHSYEEALAFLSEKNKEYQEKNHDKTETYGQIKRLNTDCEEYASSYGDCYLFDNSLRLVEVWAGECNITLLDESEYPVYVPLPFRKGDIIKVESLRYKPYYGVMPWDWKAPAKDRNVCMWLPLEFYVQGTKWTTGDFDFSDGGEHDILRASVCPDEELPEEEQVLKLIRAVRRGEMDFYLLLRKFGRGELRELFHYSKDSVLD